MGTVVDGAAWFARQSYPVSQGLVDSGDGFGEQGGFTCVRLGCWDTLLSSPAWRVSLGVFETHETGITR